MAEDTYVQHLEKNGLKLAAHIGKMRAKFDLLAIEMSSVLHTYPDEYMSPVIRERIETWQKMAKQMTEEDIHASINRRELTDPSA